MAISSDGKRFCTGGADGILKLWDYDEGVVIATANAGRVTGAAFSPDNDYVVAVSADGGVFVFRALADEELSLVSPAGAGAVAEAEDGGKAGEKSGGASDEQSECPPSP